MKKIDTTAFPLMAIFTLPCLIGGLMFIYYWIAWDVFGITTGINPYYLHYGSMWKTYMGILKEIGPIGSFLLIFLIVFATIIVVQTIRMAVYLIFYKKKYE